MENPKQFNKKWLEAVQSHPLFLGMEVGTALSLQSQTFEKHEIILHKHKHREGLFLILEGMAEVYVKNEISGQIEVLEVVQKGELIGFSSFAQFLGDSEIEDSVVEVRAVQPVEAFLIPFSLIRKRWEEPSVRDYLFRQVSRRLRDVYDSLAEQIQLASDFGENEPIMLRVQDIMSGKIVQVDSNTSIMNAANIMHMEKVSSVLVIDGNVLQGIITERDMVSRVVSTGTTTSQPIRTIMTNNPITISAVAYYYDALSTMLLKGIKHLPVFQHDKVVGIVTLSDLMRKKNENVMKTIKQIEQVDVADLASVKKAIYSVFATLLRENVPILKALEMITKLYDRLVVRIVGLSITRLEDQGIAQPADFAFYQMGSSGRGEQFMLTDQDHFLVYEKDDAYFQRLGQEITSLIEAAGYERCKGLMMCSEKQWRGKISDWEDRVRSWSLQSTNANLLLAQNFFSYRFITGSSSLNKQFQNTIKTLLDSSKIFLYRMAKVEREHPVQTFDQRLLSLFRLERKALDMKKSVLFPYHHSLQILSLLHGTASGTSIERINSLAEKGVLSQEFAHDLKEAVSHLLTLYVKQRWKQGEKGDSIVNLSKLSSREKDELVLSLKTIKELQSLLFGHFSL